MSIDTVSYELRMIMIVSLSVACRICTISNDNHRNKSTWSKGSYKTCNGRDEKNYTISLQ